MKGRGDRCREKMREEKKDVFPLHPRNNSKRALHNLHAPPSKQHCSQKGDTGTQKLPLSADRFLPRSPAREHSRRGGSLISFAFVFSFFLNFPIPSSHCSLIAPNRVHFSKCARTYDPKRVNPGRDDRGSAICRVVAGKLSYSVDKEY